MKTRSPGKLESATAFAHLRRTGRRLILLALCGSVLIAGLFLYTSHFLDIHQAAEWGNTTAAKWILQRTPALVNARNEEEQTPLHLAARWNRASMAGLLLDKGAGIESPDSSGLTPLHVAAYWGNSPVVALLLNRGADVNASAKVSIHHGFLTQSPYRNWTPLHCAAARGHVDVVRTLLARGAEVNSQTALDSTALEFAASKGHRAVVEILVANGATINRREGVLGKTALQYAQDNGYEEIAEFLRKNGAKE